MISIFYVVYFTVHTHTEANLIKVSSDDVHIPSEGFQVVIALLGAEVPCAENVLDLPRH